jgi:hypothetical protein
MKPIQQLQGQVSRQTGQLTEDEMLKKEFEEYKNFKKLKGLEQVQDIQQQPQPQQIQQQQQQQKSLQYVEQPKQDFLYPDIFFSGKDNEIMLKSKYTKGSIRQSPPVKKFLENPMEYITKRQSLLFYGKHGDLMSSKHLSQTIDLENEKKLYAEWFVRNEKGSEEEKMSKAKMVYDRIQLVVKEVELLKTDSTAWMGLNLTSDVFGTYMSINNDPSGIYVAPRSVNEFTGVKLAASHLEYTREHEERCNLVNDYREDNHEFKVDHCTGETHDGRSCEVVKKVKSGNPLRKMIESGLFWSKELSNDMLIHVKNSKKPENESIEFDEKGWRFVNNDAKEFKNSMPLFDHIHFDLQVYEDKQSINDLQCTDEFKECAGEKEMEKKLCDYMKLQSFRVRVDLVLTLRLVHSKTYGVQSTLDLQLDK